MTTWTMIPQSPINRTTVNRNLRHQPKMNRDKVNHSKIESQVLRKQKKLTAFKPQTGYQGKDLIVVHYVHVVQNVHCEAVSLKQEEKGRRE